MREELQSSVRIAAERIEEVEKCGDQFAILGADGEETLKRTAEDTVLRKLPWYTAGGGVSDSQWRDVLGVIMTGGGDIDCKYLRAWADRLDLADALERALREADAS